MMISPEAYYLELKGITTDELQTRIRRLKNQMGSLKNKMEKPHYVPDLVFPSDSTQLYWTREYLAMAKRAFVEAGGEYRESAAERRASEFLNQLPFLKKLSFSIGGYFGGHNVYSLEIENGFLHLSGQHYPDESAVLLNTQAIKLEEEEIKTADDLFNYLREMHIEEWRSNYDTSRFGYVVCDGTQWELRLEYNNGHHPWITGGSNSYPYNFLDLLKLFGEKHPEAEIEDEETEEKYLYCQVTPADMNRSYFYISEIEYLQRNDIVVIPFGLNNKEIYGTVSSAEWYTESEAPYPPEFTKKILRKATEEEKYKLIEPDITEYTYCYVIPEGQTRGYSYISEIDDLQTGDIVIIPFGTDNREVFGKVSSVRRVTARKAPYPPEKTKRILRKAVSEEQFEFLTVLPITHKQKTFGYINTLPNVEVGDYVDIEFRDGYRIAQVLSKTRGSLSDAPANFMGTMKVIWKRSYADCEYIRFKTDLVPLMQAGELYRPDGFSDNSSLRKPRLTKKAVETFEKVYGVKLPDDYIHFVTEISNGYDFIAGLNVEEYKEEYTRLRKGFLYDDLIDLAKKDGGYNNLRYDCECESCSDCDYKLVCPDSDFEYDPYDYEGINIRFRQGTLRLTNDKGDITDLMIVKGKHAGTVIRCDDYSGTRTIFAESFHEYLQILAGNTPRRD